MAGTFEAPLFCAADVCDALGIDDAGKAANRLDPEEVEIVGEAKKGSHAVVVRGAQATVYVTESGLYRLVVRSNKPQAEAFTDWVTGEVLPAIRKHGYYSAARAHRSSEPQPRARFLIAMSGISVLRGGADFVAAHGCVRCAHAAGRREGTC